MWTRLYRQTNKTKILDAEYLTAGKENSEKWPRLLQKENAQRPNAK